jgi:hypothetical protein
MLTDVAGKGAAAMGAGALIDYSSSLNTEDNALGTLKESFPAQLGWIPNEIATLDNDSPDTKRMKNMLEGMGLGLFLDVAGSFIKGARAFGKTSEFVPSNEMSSSLFKTTKSDPDFAKDLQLDVTKKESSLDELGKYNLEYDLDLDKPKLGVHDLYDTTESGIRTTDDGGIWGAAVDAERIASNVDTVYGRLGNFISEPALKFSLNNPQNYDALMTGLTKQLDDAGDFAFRTASGKEISAKGIQNTGEAMVADMMDMDITELRQFVSRYSIQEGNTLLLKGDAAGAVSSSMKQYMEQYASLNRLRVGAYTAASEAGQVSDMATASRYLMDQPGAERVQEQILDKIEFLMVTDGQNKNAARNMMKTANVARQGGTVADLEAMRLDEVAALSERAKELTDSLRGVAKERPDMLEPLMFTYEATDGMVRSMTALTDYYTQSTGVINKAIMDNSPEIPSVVVKGAWQTIYNNMLLGFGTPIKAAASNIVTLVERPLTILAGAAMQGDGYTIRRGMYQLTSMGETLSNGFKYMGETFRRSGIDPSYSGVAGREDIINRNQDVIKTLNKYADGAAAEGNLGPQITMTKVEMLQDLADNPWMRFGTRSMQALDGFTQAVIGSQEAKGRAFDALSNKQITENQVKNFQTRAYEDMFGTQDGYRVIKDEQVRKASGELVFNLETEASTAINSVVSRYPGLKPFLLFTKTPVNMLKYFGSHNPVGVFTNQFDAFKRPFGEMKTEKVHELLTARGISTDDPQAMATAYNQIRAELKGRKAMGALAVTGAFTLFMNDNITGSGTYDNQKQRLRRDAGWKPKSIRVPGGNWVSYENLGAIGDWLSLTADVMDNFGNMDDNDLATQMNAMGYILSASIVDKTALPGVEPLFNILSGDPAAINRWAGSFMASTIPGSGQINDLNKLISPQLKIVDNNLISMFSNRTPLKSTLPDQYDWIDGGLVNDQGNFLSRVFNAYSPFKVSGKISPEKQFLIDIEYDNRPSMRTDGKGTDLTPEEQSAIYNHMGEHGYFRTELKRIMQGTEAKQFRKDFEAAQAQNLPIKLSDYQNLHTLLNRAMGAAKKMSIEAIDAQLGGSITVRQSQASAAKTYSRQSDTQRLQQLANNKAK